MNEKQEKRANPKDGMKNRLPIGEMKIPIETFCKEQKEMYIATKNDTDFPELEVAEYRYFDGKHLLILTPASIFLNKFENGTKFTGFIFDKQGKGLKMTKRIYGNFISEILSTDADLLQTMAQTDELVKRMLTHGAKFVLLKVEQLTAYFGGNEIFALDNDMNPSFAEVTPNGKKRYENVHHVLMEYEGREVIFNTIIKEGVYYTLTKADSNKMEHIKAGKECKFYDGRDNHFTSKMTILEESKTQEIFDELVEKNHAYFKKIDGLVALSYSNQ